MASYARNRQQPYAQSGEQSYDRRKGRSSTPPRQQQHQQHQQHPQHPQQQLPYRQAQPPPPMTIEQYQASRRAAGNITPQRQRNVTPQRQRNVTPQRAPPPGKFSTQPQNAYGPPPPQQQQVQPQQQYRQVQKPQYNQNRNMGQNLQYHQNPHQGQHPQYQYQNPQYPQSNNFTNQITNQGTTQNYAQQKAAAAAAAGTMAQNSPNRNVHQEQRQTNSPMSRRDYHFQQAQQMQVQQEGRQAVDMEDQYNMHIMREREAEVAAIKAKMNKVNDIYKDLAGLIDGHQDLIDQVDVNIEESHAHTKAGITNYEEARLMMENPIMEDFFGDKIGKRSNSARPNTPREAGKRRVRKARDSNKRNKSSKYDDDDDDDDFQCDGPLEAIQDNLIDVINEMKVFGSRVFLACTGPDVGSNEYATDR